MNLFYNDLLQIRRHKIVSGNRRAYIATATAEASIQPLGKEKGALDIGQFGATFVAYVDMNVSIKKGDRVKDKAGNIYNVHNLIVRDYGAFPYQELILKKTP